MTDLTLDGQSLYSPVPKFKMNELETLDSESIQSRRIDKISQISGVGGRIYSKEEAL
jgi:hypothetical protein